MKKRLAIAAGGLALVTAAAIPTSGAFGVTESHCAKLNSSIDTASAIIGATNSGQASNVQMYLNFSRGKCD